MAASKIAITIDDKLLNQIDILVKTKYFVKSGYSGCSRETGSS